MAETVTTTQLLCKQCAAVLVVEQGAQYATCEYCGTVNFLDKSESVLHYAVRPTIDDAQATAALRRWMAGNHTVKGWTPRPESSRNGSSTSPCGWRERK